VLQLQQQPEDAMADDDYKEAEWKETPGKSAAVLEKQRHRQRRGERGGGSVVDDDGLALRSPVAALVMQDPELMGSYMDRTESYMELTVIYMTEQGLTWT
jgi:hypothetical protein